jgi:hypothetical protein
MERRSIVLVALAAAAGAIHLAMAPAHGAESAAHGVAFALAGWAQLALAGALLARPSRTLVALGAVLSGAFLVAWVVSRTVGLPVLGEEEVGLVDALCAGLELAFVLAGVAILAERWSGTASPALAAVAAIGAMTVSSAALASPAGEHGADAHGHASGDSQHPVSTAHHDDTTSHDASAHHRQSSCTEPVTAEQEAAAAELVEQTEATLARFEDVKVAEGAGYRRTDSPGEADTHYLNAAHALDGAVLDPDRPESLVYISAPSGQQFLVGAMYLNDDPSTDPPRPGGCTTAWHDHPGVCLGSGQIAVPTSDVCPGGTRLGDTTDMLHVWLLDLPTGRFGELTEVEPAVIRDALIARYATR